MKTISFQNAMTADEIVDNVYEGLTTDSRASAIVSLISLNSFLAGNGSAEAGRIINLPRDESLSIRRSTDARVVDPLGDSVNSIQETIVAWEGALSDSFSEKLDSEDKMLAMASNEEFAERLSASEEGADIREQLVSNLDGAISDSKGNQNRIAAAISTVLGDLDSLQQRL